MGAHVVMGCRDVEKAKVVMQYIQDDTGIENMATLLPLDLGSFKSIRKFVKDFHELNMPLHILVNNAGVMLTPEQRTEDGIEYQIGINHFGHFLLTYLLLDDLKKKISLLELLLFLLVFIPVEKLILIISTWMVFILE